MIYVFPVLILIELSFINSICRTCRKDLQKLKEKLGVKEGE